MDIILLERIEKLGAIGDVVSVKDGYARNFLLPQKKALRANEANKQVFEANRERLEAENAERRSEAEKAGEKVDGAEIVLIRASSNSGQLYGSVNVRDIAAALEEQGHSVDKRQVIMGSPIKTIGVHEVTIALHPEVRVPSPDRAHFLCLTTICARAGGRVPETNRRTAGTFAPARCWSGKGEVPWPSTSSPSASRRS